MATSIIDQPTFTDPTQDQLNMKVYSEALVEFIDGARTPLTIALQGEWGSGKTSLMNALKRKLAGDDGNFFGVWVNTWQYSLLSNTNDAIVKILLGLINQVAAVSRAPTAKGSVGKLTRKLLSITTSVVNQVLVKQTGVDAEKTLGHIFADNDGLSDIESLKVDLAKVLKDALDQVRQKRGFIFFIDDLDRIDPPVAVQILELLKNIFDLENCIFVLAIDYGVVVKGLKSKFGEKTLDNEREFRSFFDKIIQLPFKMPVEKYCIDDFLMSSLREIGYVDSVEVTNQEFCETLSSYAMDSIGTNPRALKRLINSLSLMRILVRHTDTKVDDQNFRTWKDVVFALECIKIQYPLIQAALDRFPCFTQWGTEFQQTLRLEEVSESEKKKLSKDPEGLFKEPWEIALFALCKKDRVIESQAFKVCRMLNQIKSRIEGRNEHIESVLRCLIRLSDVTSIKSDLSVPVTVEEFNSSSLLKVLRSTVFGMERLLAEEGDSYYAAWLADDIALVSWQKRVQANLYVDFVHSHNKEFPYRSDFGIGVNFRFEASSTEMALVVNGNFGGNPDDGVLHLSEDEMQQDLSAVEGIVKQSWQHFDVTAEVEHNETNLWFVVRLPLSNVNILEDTSFQEHFQASFKDVFCAFLSLKPYCDKANKNAQKIHAFQQNIISGVTRLVGEECALEAEGFIQKNDCNESTGFTVEIMQSRIKIRISAEEYDCDSIFVGILKSESGEYWDEIKAHCTKENGWESNDSWVWKYCAVATCWDVAFYRRCQTDQKYLGEVQEEIANLIREIADAIR